MMTIGFLFWLLMLFWLVLGLISWPRPPEHSPWAAYMPLGGSILTFLLFFLLGWKVFGWPISG